MRARGLVEGSTGLEFYSGREAEEDKEDEGRGSEEEEEEDGTGGLHHNHCHVNLRLNTRVISESIISDKVQIHGTCSDNQLVSDHSTLGIASSLQCSSVTSSFEVKNPHGGLTQKVSLPRCLSKESEESTKRRRLRGKQPLLGALVKVVPSTPAEAGRGTADEEYDEVEAAATSKRVLPLPNKDKIEQKQPGDRGQEACPTRVTTPRKLVESTATSARLGPQWLPS